MSTLDSNETLNGIRPETLSEFVGQNHLKELIRTTAAASHKRNAPFPHTLLTGAAGLGKTSLARLIAIEMGIGFVSTTAEALDNSSDVKGLLSKLDDHGYDGKGNVVGATKPTVLLVDEAHRLPRHSQELLYGAVEDRVLESIIRNPITGMMTPTREWVPCFTLVMASNRPGDLTTSLRDRLRLNLRLEPYDQNDSAKIARQVLEKFSLKCGNKQAALIASRGRGVPRKIVALCEQVRDISIGKNKTTVSTAICEAAFESLCIDPIGLARLDVEVLKLLSNNLGQPVGLNTLASLVGEDQRALEETVEPFLMHRGLIVKTGRGRVLTRNGIEHLRNHHGLKVSGRTLS